MEIMGKGDKGGKRVELGSIWYIYMKMSVPNPLVYTMNMSVNFIINVRKGIYSNMKT